MMLMTMLMLIIKLGVMRNDVNGDVDNVGNDADDDFDDGANDDNDAGGNVVSDDSYDDVGDGADADNVYTTKLPALLGLLPKAKQAQSVNLSSEKARPTETAMGRYLPRPRRHLSRPRRHLPRPRRYLPRSRRHLPRPCP